MHPELEREIIAAGGVAMRARLGAVTYDRLVRRGQCRVLLPGVAVLEQFAEQPVVRAAAALAYDPDAVVVGRTAAALTWWPELRTDGDLQVLTSRSVKVNPHGYQWIRGGLPAELVLEQRGLRVAVPEVSAIHLIPELGARVVDEALRRRIPLPALQRALDLTPGRRGNQLRRAVLLDSRDQPWSEAERLAHSLLRDGGVQGWRANHRVELRRPELTPQRHAFLDIAFQRLQLGIEIDGTEYHSSPAASSRDRLRDLVLVLQGWIVVRFPASSVESAHWVDTVTELVAMRCAQLSQPPADFVLAA